MNYKEIDLDSIKGLDVGQLAALTAARRSILKKFSTGAALVKDGKVIEIGWSHIGHVRRKTTPWSTHAEAHLFQRIGPRREECDLYIATVSSKGNLTLGLPCESCENLLKRLGAEKIIFTNPSGNWDSIYRHELNIERKLWKEKGY